MRLRHEQTNNGIENTFRLLVLLQAPDILQMQAHCLLTIPICGNTDYTAHVGTGI